MSIVQPLLQETTRISLTASAASVGATVGQSLTSQLFIKDTGTYYITVSPGGLAVPSNASNMRWVVPASIDPTQFYVKVHAEINSGSVTSFSGPYDVWTLLSSTASYYVSAGTSGVANVTLNVLFATDSGGVNIVGSGTATMNLQRD